MFMLSKVIKDALYINGIIHHQLFQLDIPQHVCLALGVLSRGI